MMRHNPLAAGQNDLLCATRRRFMAGHLIARGCARLLAAPGLAMVLLAALPPISLRAEPPAGPQIPPLPMVSALPVAPPAPGTEAPGAAHKSVPDPEYRQTVRWQSAPGSGSGRDGVPALRQTPEPANLSEIAPDGPTGTRVFDAGTAPRPTREAKPTQVTKPPVPTKEVPAKENRSGRGGGHPDPAGANGITGAAADSMTEFGPCPAGLIRQAFARPLPPTDLADLLALEKDTLTLCAERARQIAEVIKNDREIAKLRAGLRADSPPPDTPAAAPPSAETENPGDTADLFGKKPLKTAPAKTVLRKAGAKGASPRPAGPRWFLRSVYGANDNLTAGIADRAGHVWFLKPGDRLPDGSKLTSIRVVPTRVTLTRHGMSGLLPREPLARSGGQSARSRSASGQRASPGGFNPGDTASARQKQAVAAFALPALPGGRP